MGEKKLGKTNIALAILLEKTYWDAYFSAMVLHEGVHAFLTALSERGIRVCIITDLTTRLQCEKLERLGISEHIEYLVSSEEAGVEKPDRRIFELALHKLGLAPKEVVVIGDDEKRDILGAEALGIPFIHYYDEL
jgi:putative hydrolase of the HAD superfamily